MIICFYKKQAEMLLKQSSFEVDMAYKRIRQRNINEVLFATLLKAEGKGKITLLVGLLLY